MHVPRLVLEGRSLLAFALDLEFLALAVAAVWMAAASLEADPLCARLGLATLCCLAPHLLLQRTSAVPMSLVNGALLGIILAAFYWGSASRPRGNVAFSSVFSFLAGIGALKAAFMLAAVIAERPTRSYDTIERQLDAVISKPGKIGFSQRAWLALRKTHGPADIHFMVDCIASPQDLDQRSLVLLDPRNLGQFSFFVVDRSKIDALKVCYPVFRAALDSGQFFKATEIVPPASTWSITGSGGYDLVVFERRAR